jgi:hypothetical protein
MRYTPIIGSQDDNVEYQSIKPKHYPCPQCGKKGKRKRVRKRNKKVAVKLLLRVLTVPHLDLCSPTHRLPSAL